MTDVTDPHLAALIQSAAPEDLIRDHVRQARSALAAGAAAGNRGAVWRPGEPLRLLLAGYNGTGNTGADVRTAEIVRQIRSLLGPDAVAPEILVLNDFLPAELFPGVRQRSMDGYFVPALAGLALASHGVIGCEGGLFKSNMSGSFCTMVAGAMGMAWALDKPACAYGAEAGAMGGGLVPFVREMCDGALVITRNEESSRHLSAIGVDSETGADTAWTFDPAPPEQAEALLRAAGWDGQAEILGLCPVNPFWWPLTLDLKRVAAAEDPRHYGGGFFHRDDEEARAAFTRYLDGIATAVTALRRETGIFPIIVGMERIDREACAALAERLGSGVPVFLSGSRTPGELVALLRRCGRLVSSRFHAVVTAMPAGVPAVALSMDERLGRLLGEGADAGGRLIATDDPLLAERLLAALRAIPAEREAHAAQARAVTAAAVRTMGAMGIRLLDHLRGHLPDLPVPDRPRRWDTHLPPLPRLIRAILSGDRHEGTGA